MVNNTGGPAFPHVADLIQHSPNGGITTKQITSGGMTLRDYFAAKAMQGMLADLPKTMYGIDWQDNVAKGAYQLADAMLAAREQK